jgi:hypothetical protein
MTCEDLGGDIVWRADSGVSHQSSRSSPVVNLRSVADREINLINGNRISVTRAVRAALQKLLVIVVIVQTVEPSGETEVSQLYVTATVQ